MNERMNARIIDQMKQQSKNGKRIEETEKIMEERDSNLN